jgi:hypothetical protein
MPAHVHEQKPTDQIAAATANALLCIVQSLRQFHPELASRALLSKLRDARMSELEGEKLPEEARLFASMMDLIL